MCAGHLLGRVWQMQCAEAAVRAARATGTLVAAVLGAASRACACDNLRAKLQQLPAAGAVTVAC